MFGLQIYHKKKIIVGNIYSYEYYEFDRDNHVFIVNKWIGHTYEYSRLLK